ncbi:hypothetical protein ACFLUL_00820 [Chloroflexota bacterium]
MKRKAFIYPLVKAFSVLFLLSACLPGNGCASGQDFDSRLNSIVKPYLFSVTGWELKAIPEEIAGWFSGGQEDTADEAGAVIDYFTLIERINTLEKEIRAAGTVNGNTVSLEDELDILQERKAALAGAVESIIERQVMEVLALQGIYSPLIGPEVSFPPVNFRLSELPFVLVISPRERIESIREITLEPALTLQERWNIEAAVDKLGVSSLVVRIGGIATYPTLVGKNASLQSTIETVAEEWAHQYLAFKPLGFKYILDLTGLSRDYEIATMNETVASMVSEEIVSTVFDTYYAEYETGTGQEMEEGEFDFNLEMREIRKAVDAYLARGEIEQAEEYMEQKRQELASMGYYIRKLNQAYFAFHGAYASSPTSVSPIGTELRALRDRSTSLKDFLDTVSAMSSRQELQDSIK